MHSVEQAVHFLEKYNLVLSTAESSTAGLLASTVAAVPGCDGVLESGFVVYSKRAMHACLGVDLRTIESFGMNSEEVAREMALGVLVASSADIILAITGANSADEQASEQSLEGTMCFACATRLDEHRGVTSETVSFTGDDNDRRHAAVRHALLQLPYYYERLRQT
ncbi:CinA family protein [Phytopseudomonas dryadis]|uniref:Ompetence-damaged protein n=1 Tax=Phytopseudomonas dryadis TaxID=2487520 RepID=A0A4Q9RBV8_9GAMM|nr:MULTISPECIES: CinA family protein [Pseudomonas]TBU97509.1 ompetence-damaged protein [Pseudomonas dryadis]TBV09981.1 ompetence-damaged protein [Pseudomonas dryadis]TBV19190.1 ompetence-damaged protein [Pseudomonas sp. FRB 230]